MLTMFEENGIVSIYNLSLSAKTAPQEWGTEFSFSQSLRFNFSHINIWQLIEEVVDIYFKMSRCVTYGRTNSYHKAN